MRLGLITTPYVSFYRDLHKRVDSSQIFTTIVAGKLRGTAPVSSSLAQEIDIQQTVRTTTDKLVLARMVGSHFFFQSLPSRRSWQINTILIWISTGLSSLTTNFFQLASPWIFILLGTKRI